MDMFFSQFHFLRPFVFFLIFLLFFIILILKKRQNTGGSWKKICSPELLKYLQVGEYQQTRFPVWIWLLGIGGLLAITALAGPVWQKQPQAIYREASALVVALDLSRSMDASDVKPSRLIRAKQKLSDLLKLRKEGLTALIAFAGTAYVVTPLTDDTKTILSQLDGLTTDIMPKQGGALDPVMIKAMALFQQASIKHGQLLYLTDSDDVTDVMVKEFTAAGHQLSVISLGTEQGAPIGKSDGGFLSDGHGDIVIAKLNVSLLRHVASLGDGIYHALTLDNADIAPILTRLKPSLIDQMDDGAKKEINTQYDAWHEEGAWLLLVLLPLALLGFRRGLLLVVLCVGMQVKPVEASLWNDMWHTKNHQAETLMQEKIYKKAAETFENPAWRMSAHYRDKNYKAALQDFEHIPNPKSDDWYNKGNALAQLGKLDEAIEAYNAALRVNPQHKDAKANKALLEKLKKEQEKSSDKQKKSQNKQKKKAKQGSHKNEHSDGKQGQQDDSKLGKDSQKQGESKQKNKDNKAKAQSSAQKSQGKSQSDKQKEAKQKHSKNGKNKTQMQPPTSANDAQKEESKQNQRTEEDMKKIEEKQAFEQNLRRIPDDPGGLLRRKFLYQYQQQGGKTSAQDGKAW